MRKQGDDLEKRPPVYQAEIIKKFIHKTGSCLKFLDIGYQMSYF